MTGKTLLHRQAHPNFIIDGQLSSQAFIPFPKDRGLLSVYDGDQVAASEAFRHYTLVLKLLSHSVWSVTKEETDTEGVKADHDPLHDFPAHAKIDFTTKTEKECRKIAKKLRNLAHARGCQFEGLREGAFSD